LDLETRVRKQSTRSEANKSFVYVTNGDQMGMF
jgi:hypothetical protein